MRELHVVAVSEDGRHVLLGATKAAKSGTFKVKLDDRLVAAVRGDLRLAETPTPELSPKEIQARLRAGESAESIARKAGVAITRVERFAGPVAGEMARMIDAARDARLVRRSGPSRVPLGKAVAGHVGDAEAVWTTRREDDGRWRVTVAWTARNRRRSGSWWWDPHSNELTAADPASASLGHVDEESAKRPPKPPAAPKPAPVTTRAAKETAAAAKKPAAAARKTPAKAKPAAKRSAAASTPTRTAKRTVAKPVRTAKQAVPAAKPTRSAKQAVPAAKPSRSAKQAVPAAKPARSAKQAVPAAKPTRSAKQAVPAAKPSRAAKHARPRLQVVPDPEPRPKARKAAEQRDGVSARASVPAWADVLLGTTPNDR